MLRTNRGIRVASTLLLAAIFMSACQQPYSTPPAVTNTPIDTNSFFTTPIPDEPNGMDAVELFTTQTAMAAELGAETTGTPGTPQPTTDSTEGAETLTPTPLVNLVPTATATLAVSSGASTTSSPVPVAPGSRPASYTLKTGEFPYCIARRFNVDPDQLMSQSGLSSSQADSLAAGTVLSIPQSGTFPGNRAWHAHPATFTVGTTYDTNTVYGVACYYGDIDPSAIAQANNISVDAKLTAGQTLSIP